MFESLAAINLSLGGIAKKTHPEFYGHDLGVGFTTLTLMRWSYTANVIRDHYNPKETVSIQVL